MIMRIQSAMKNHLDQMYAKLPKIVAKVEIIPDNCAQRPKKEINKTIQQ